MSTLIFVDLLHKVYLKIHLSILNKRNLKYTTFWLALSNFVMSWICVQKKCFGVVFWPVEVDSIVSFVRPDRPVFGNSAPLKGVA